MPDSKLIDIAGEIRHETDKAWLMFDGLKEIWLPKALVEYYDDGKGGIFTMPNWLARDKGLI